MEPLDSYADSYISELQKRLLDAESRLSDLPSRHNRSEKALDTLRFISKISKQPLDRRLSFNQVLPGLVQTLDCVLAAFYRIDPEAA